MTQQEAAEKAWALVRSRNIPVVALERVFKVEAAPLGPRLAVRGNFWSAIFELPRNPDIRIPGGDSLVIVVYERTGEAVVQKAM